MNEVLVKYNELDILMQQQVLEFMDYLLSKKDTVKPVNMSEYKKRLLDISTWSEDSIKVFYENVKSFNQWNIAEF